MFNHMSIYKKTFMILFAVFVIDFIIELISILMGNPITDIHISGLDLEKKALETYILRAFLSAHLIPGFVNLFLTVKIIKHWRNIDHLPTVITILLTIFIPITALLSMILVIPNIIIWGIKSFFDKPTPKIIQNEFIAESATSDLPSEQNNS